MTSSRAWAATVVCLCVLPGLGACVAKVSSQGDTTTDGGGSKDSGGPTVDAGGPGDAGVSPDGGAPDAGGPPLTGANCDAGTCYYIDCATGSDANTGRSTAFPWKRHPYMSGFSGAYTHVAGDQFVFKGGVTCPNVAFPLVPAAGGTPSSPDYYGVDASWFAGSLWTRPIFDAQGREVDGGNVEFNFDANRISWVTIDNIEFKGHYWSGQYAYTQNVTILASFTEAGIVVRNCYFHGWSHAPYDGGETPDSYIIVNGTTWAVPANPGCLIDSCIFDGSDADGVSAGATYNWPVISNSTFHDLENAVHGAAWQVNGNHIYNIRASYDPSIHENAIESWLIAGYAGTQYIFDNVIHDTDLSVYPLPIGPGFGKTGAVSAYVFNNVLWNIAHQPVAIDPLCTGSTCTPEQWNIYLWNNTIVTSLIPPYNGNIACIEVGNRSTGNIGVVDIENNHCVTDSGELLTYAAGAAVNTLNNSHNLVVTNAAAAAEGYGAADAYAPSSAEDATVAAGNNLTSRCSELGSYAAAGCADIRTVERPASAPWDVGAYQFQ